MQEKLKKAIHLPGVKEIWLQTFWDIYGFQFDSQLGVIWPLDQTFQELEDLIDQDQIEYEIVEIFFIKD